MALFKRIPFPGKNLVPCLQQIRTTYVVERVHPARLVKPEKKPSLRGKHYVYRELESNIPGPQKLVPIVLTKYVEDIGQAGEIVSIKENVARFLIMTYKAAYASKQNIEKYAEDAVNQKTYSSKYVSSTLGMLQKFVLNISMNKENPWTLEPWHVSSAFRKAGVCVPQSAITMPEHTINGPDMALEGKEFYVTVTINGQEQVVVRARIHHWATSPAGRLPPVRDHWKFPVDKIFAEDKEIEKSLPEIVAPVYTADDEEKSAQKLKKYLRGKQQGI